MKIDIKPGDLFSKRNIALAISLAGVLLVWTGPMLLTVKPQLSYGDEGVLAQSAMRILAGQVPYRDFFTATTPGAFYWFALFIKLFDTPFLGLRMGVLVVAFSNLVLSLLIIQKFKSLDTLTTLFAVTALGFLLGPTWYIASIHWLSLMWCLLSLYLLLWGMDNGLGGWKFFLAGAAATLAAFTMQVKGGIWILGALTALALLPRGARLRGCSWFLGGTLCSAAPLAGYMFSAVGLDLLIEDLIVFPTTRYHMLEGQAFSLFKYLADGWASAGATLKYRESFTDLIRTASAYLSYFGYLTILIFPILGAASIFWSWKKNYIDKNRLTLLFSFFACMYLSYYYRISDTTLGFAAPVAILPISILIGSINKYKKNTNETFKLPLNITKSATIIFATILALMFTTQNLEKSVIIKAPAGDLINFRSGDLQTHQGIVEFFNQYAKESDQIFCFSYAAFFYFMLQKENPTRFDLVTPPMTSPQQLREIQEDLEKARTPYLVWDYAPLEGTELWRYLVKNYDMVANFKYASVLKRKGLDE